MDVDPDLVRRQPLTGLRVVEAAQMISAPFASAILADQGAEVIKVEAANGVGDRMRTLGDIRNGVGTVFHACNRNKRSIAVDTRTDEGTAILHDLIATADVFIQNFRPGAVERMGVGPDLMLARHPDLVYVSVSGFGPTGPYADQMVYDFVIQGLIGMAAHQGLADGDPALLLNLVVDKATAITVAQATTAALLAVARGAGGQHLEVSMLDAGLQFFWPDGGWGHGLLGEGGRSVPPMATNYEVRPTADGHITLNLATNSTWPRLAAAIDERLMDDPRFATYEDRQRNAAALREAVDAVLSTVDTTAALERLRANDMPGGPVLGLADVADDPQVTHRNSFVEYDSVSIGGVREARPAARFEAAEPAEPAGAPGYGAQTTDILGELGRTPADIDALVASGVVAAGG